MLRTALIVDVHNLYSGASRKFPGKSINYSALTEWASVENDVFHRIAYGRQPVEKVAYFAKMLSRLGYELCFANQPHNIDMALTVANLINNKAIDHLILGTNYFEAGRILSYARSRGVYTTVVGFDIPVGFRDFATVIEIPEDFLQERPSETADANVLHPNISSDLIPSAA